MPAREFIVLRAEPLGVPAMMSMGVAKSRAVPGASAGSMELQRVPLTEAERVDLRRDPRVRAIAEPMPMRLIEPLAGGATAEPAGAKVTWGVQAVGAAQSPFTGEGIVVAVLDTGIDPSHAAFRGVDLVRRNFTQEGDDDQHGHGTHCAGTIFGRAVDGLRIGVAPGVRKALIAKVLGKGGGSSAEIAKAIQWAVNEGAHVVSMSLGIDFPGFVESLIRERGMDPRPATSMALEQYRANVDLFSALADLVRVQSAFSHGTVIVAASGNESDRPRFEIAVSPPAAGAGVVSVGALQQGSQGYSVADFSNNRVDVAAPGVDVISAQLGGGLVPLSGTSMATPHAAGVAALWAQKLSQTLGTVETETLVAQLVGRTQTSALAPGFEEDDVGAGLVQAPLN